MKNDTPKRRQVIYTSQDCVEAQLAAMRKIVLCQGCHFSFEIGADYLPYCLRCQRMAQHLDVDLPSSLDVAIESEDIKTTEE